MPSHYQYRCTDCGHVEERYRNCTRCRKCRGLIERMPEPQVTRLDALVGAVKHMVTWATVDGRGRACVCEPDWREVCDCLAALDAPPTARVSRAR